MGLSRFVGGQSRSAAKRVVVATFLAGYCPQRTCSVRNCRLPPPESGANYWMGAARVATMLVDGRPAASIDGVARSVDVTVKNGAITATVDGQPLPLVPP